MGTLSKEREQELMEGVKQAIDLVDADGLSPDQALEKVARQYKWGREMIKLAAYAYNTGRQVAQRQVNTTILDKLAEFPLADASAVIREVWPQRVKAAADIEMETGVSADYERPPMWLESRRQTRSLEKAASADHLLSGQTRMQAYAPDPMVKAEKTYNRYLELKKQAEEARYQASAAKDRLIGSMGLLADYFKKHARDRLPFDVVEHAVAVYYPAAAKTALDYAYKRNRLREKRAAETPLPTAPIDQTSEPFTLIKQCLDHAERLSRLQELHKEAEDELARFREGELSPFVRMSQDKQAGRASCGYLIDSPAPPPQKPQKKAGFWSSVAGSTAADRTKSILDEALSGAPEPQQVQTTLTELTDPSHEAELRRIRAQALLSEMMDDPVIGGYQPTEVLRAYNEISQLSPHGAMQPIVARSLLRRYLQGGMEPFEAKEIAETEKSIAATSARPPSLFKELENTLV